MPVLALNALVVVAALVWPARVLPFALAALAATVVVGILSRGSKTAKPRPISVAPASPGDPVASYELRKLLATGGMGEVWLARHRTLGRDVALKRIKSGDIDDEDVKRFEREARVLSTLTSPHTVEVFDFGATADGGLFYAMELLDGIDLQTAIKEHGPIPPERVVYLLAQACASLKEAHDQGLVHRDIKPANFMICRYGGEFDFLKVLDFGLVKKPVGPSGDAGITRPAAVLGTAAYLAPESVKGSKFVDGRADLYALGAIGFWLLTGRLVFEHDRAMAMINAHITEPPPPSSEHSKFAIPPDLDELLLACLAKDPKDRPADAGTLRRRLEQIPFAERWDQDRAALWWRSLPPRHFA
ncbi:MAG TPA: serine/threonine-protein kinase [Polyangiaceae bacterium]|nr:serine/threonine-protein kinase [Polyangiaceae bacterium]